MENPNQISNEIIREKIYEVLNALSIQNEWFSIAEAADYIGVSMNTFLKFHKMGLPIVYIGKIRKVSKTEIDNFLKTHMY